MRIPNNVRSGEVGFNMTPMIDVVFLLIIFFLVSSHLAKQEAQMELPLPDAETGEAAAADQLPRVTVNVLDDGTLLMSGRRVPHDELAERLQEKLSRSGPDLEVRIRSHREAPYGLINPVMKACTDVNIWNVTFAVYRKERSR